MSDDIEDIQAVLYENVLDAMVDAYVDEMHVHPKQYGKTSIQESTDRLMSWGESMELLRQKQREEEIQAMLNWDPNAPRERCEFYPKQEYTPQGAKINGVVAMLKNREKGKRR